MPFVRRTLTFALASLTSIACVAGGGGGGDDEGDALACPETGALLLPDIARVQPRYALGCEASSWASDVEAPSAAWTIELERTNDFTTLVPSSSGVVAVSGRDARWIDAQGQQIVQRDLGTAVGWNTLQGDFDGRLAVGGSNTGGRFYRVFDGGGTEIWLRLLAGFGSPSIQREGGVLWVGTNEFNDTDTLLRVERWELTGAKQDGDVVMTTWGNAFARDGQGRFAVLQDSILMLFDGDGAALGSLALGSGDYPYITQFVGTEDGFYAVGADTDPFVSRIVFEANAPSVAWTRRVGQPTIDWEICYGVALLPEGGIVVVGGEGTIHSRFPDSPLIDSTQPFVLALDEQGDALWGERIAAVGSAYAVTVGSEGEVYVAGTAQAGPPNEYGGASSVAWLRRYDP